MEISSRDKKTIHILRPSSKVPAMKTVIKQLPEEAFAAAQNFYATVGYHTPIGSKDLVLAAFNENEIIGLVRLAPELDFIVLRGMMIAPSYQRHGLGSAMLFKLKDSIGSATCYCLPHDWLQGFYGQIGFEKFAESEAPPHLMERLTEGQKKYPNMIIMKRRPNGL
jgi:N-acetylglutamate synthase-like GNAT family acetyltransferase